MAELVTGEGEAHGTQGPTGDGGCSKGCLRTILWLVAIAAVLALIAWITSSCSGG